MQGALQHGNRNDHRDYGEHVAFCYGHARLSCSAPGADPQTAIGKASRLGGFVRRWGGADRVLQWTLVDVGSSSAREGAQGSCRRVGGCWPDLGQSLRRCVEAGVLGRDFARRRPARGIFVTAAWEFGVEFGVQQRPESAPAVPGSGCRRYGGSWAGGDDG